MASKAKTDSTDGTPAKKPRKRPVKARPNWTSEECREFGRKGGLKTKEEYSTKKLEDENYRLKLMLENATLRAEIKRAERMEPVIQSVEVDIAQIDDADKRANRKMQYYGLTGVKTSKTESNNSVNINAPSTIQFLTRRIEPGEKVKELEEVKPE